jgi:crotonobetainyl-CoA:carnitine CoA-transferase CaiB-like acyl-CoA transferase
LLGGQELANEEGYGPEQLAAIHPGIVCVSVKCMSQSPFERWPGYDFNGAALTGLFAECGTPEQPAQPNAVNVVNAFLTGYMGAIGAGRSH